MCNKNDQIVKNNSFITFEWLIIKLKKKKKFFNS